MQNILSTYLVVAARHYVISLGSPDGQGFTHQTTGFTCDLVAQKMILDDFGVIDPPTGQPVSERSSCTMPQSTVG